MRLRIGQGNAFFAPDFLVQLADGTLELHEVKGFHREAGIVRLKVAADMFPFACKLVEARPKREGGGWDVREI